MESIVKPFISAKENLPEITVKVVVLSIFLTIILGASNAYLALKIGTTISASIPAAIISMGILRWFKKYNVLENSMVQTAASSGEALVGGIAFTIPALLVLHIWTTFDYWQTVIIAFFGSMLGVILSVPLRRVLINDRHLPYPEGLAIGTVLKASGSADSSLKPLLKGGLAGGIIAFFQSGFELFSSSFVKIFTVGNSLFAFGVGFSPAVIAAGYIVGSTLAVTTCIGYLIAWGIALPILSHIIPNTQGLSPLDFSMFIWATKIRYIGVGVMLVAGVWTFIRLITPIYTGLRLSIRARKTLLYSGDSIIRTEKDLPMHWLLGILLLITIPMIFFFNNALNHFQSISFSSQFHVVAVLTATLICLIGGFMVAAICAYIVGLVGSTNTPISGITLCIAILSSSIFVLIFKPVIDFSNVKATLDICAYVIFIAGISAVIGGISNDTMQDMKSGQIIGSTPWKQQTMLILGSIVACFVVPLVFNLLFNAYGIAGVFPRPGMNPNQMLSAPQATAVATIVSGIVTHQLDWTFILMGIGLGSIFIIVDELLKKYAKGRLPVLGLGLAIYLPFDVTSGLVIGGFISYLVKRKVKKENLPIEVVHQKEQSSMMLSCGVVAGAAIMGVVLAIPFVILKSADALKVLPASWYSLSDILGVLAFLYVCHLIYRSMKKG